MKNNKQEHLIQRQRQYHQQHPWRLNQKGLYVPHCYEQHVSTRLSWWDDFGFILNNRRVIVWWQHPRYVYEDAITEQSFAAVGDMPKAADSLLDGVEKHYKRVGKSRKRIVSYGMPPFSETQTVYYDALRAARKHLSTVGVELKVQPTWKRKRLDWATSVSLIAPLEVSCEQDLVPLADLARRLLLGEITLDAAFPDYCYARPDWLSEQSFR